MKPIFSAQSPVVRAVALALGMACLAAPAASTTLPTDPKSPATVQQHTLANGLTLIIKPDHRAPTVAHMLWVRVGSMDEVDGTSGVAHVLEHMMFKGTPNLKPGEFSRRVAALGGRENAFTSRDMTAYHQQVPAAHLEAVMKLEADRFAHNQWVDDEFKREIEVIKEERRQRVDDQPRSALHEAMNATVWKAHPYRRPVIGWMADIESLTPDDVRGFHQRWYTPANAAVVIAGDVNPAQVLAWAQATYGQVPARAVPPRKPRTEPTQMGAQRIEVKAPAEQPYVALAFHGPRLTDPDAADAASQDALALVMLAAILDGYEGARLGRQLVQHPAGQRLADSAGAYFSGTGRGPGLFVLDATPADGKDPAQLAQALRDAVAQVARDGVTPTELDRVKNQWRASEVYKLDAVFAQARELGSNWVQGWGVDASDRVLQSLRRVTSAQVQAVAGRYFGPDQSTLAVLVPDREALAQRQQAAGTRPRVSLRH